MSYMNYILKVVFLLLGFINLPSLAVFSQTCCSGGVPLSGNIGFQGAAPGAFQMDLSYDLNYLSTLKNGADLYPDENRERITQSFLLKAGYSITNMLAVDALFSYVSQTRNITYQEVVNSVHTRGIGDAVVITKLILSSLSETGTEIQLGAGPKIPLGKSDMKDSRGITLNADLQPGSGSWDLITWGFYMRQLNVRPTTTISARIVGRINGSNREYLGTQTYRFGNSFQLYGGIGDQFMVGTKVITASFSVRYRNARADEINGVVLDNTGGQWINIIPALGWSIGENSLIQLAPEIPVLSRVNGIQLTPTFRLQAGIYHTFGRKKQVKSKIYQL
jgi:hypothetical protein